LCFRRCCFPHPLHPRQSLLHSSGSFQWDMRSFQRQDDAAETSSIPSRSLVLPRHSSCSLGTQDRVRHRRSRQSDTLAPSLATERHTFHTPPTHQAATELCFRASTFPEIPTRLRCTTDDSLDRLRRNRTGQPAVPTCGPDNRRVDSYTVPRSRDSSPVSSMTRSSRHRMRRRSRAGSIDPSACWTTGMWFGGSLACDRLLAARADAGLGTQRGKQRRE